MLPSDAAKSKTIFDISLPSWRKQERKKEGTKEGKKDKLMCIKYDLR